MAQYNINLKETLRTVEYVNIEQNNFGSIAGNAICLLIQSAQSLHIVAFLMFLNLFSIIIDLQIL